MTAAVVLAAGAGKRMGGDVPKQFLMIGGRPMIAVTLEAFENCGAVDTVVLVTGAEHTEYCRKEIVEKYGLRKVRSVAAGGAERYDSVLAGLMAVPDADYVLIHDGARPYVTEELIRRTAEGAVRYGACTAAVPAKDTIKLADEEGFIARTLPRKRTWIIQTPQAFSYELIVKAHALMREQGMEDVTDDAMCVEQSGLARVKLVEGSYANIKITTPEDLPR